MPQYERPLAPLDGPSPRIDELPLAPWPLRNVAHSCGRFPARFTGLHLMRADRNSEHETSVGLESPIAASDCYHGTDQSHFTSGSTA